MEIQEELNTNGHLKMYCNRDHYLKGKEKERNTPKSFCLNCGKPIYTLTKKGKIRKYCDVECRRKKQHNEVFKYTICHYCGNIFQEKRDSPNIYCSKQCTARAVRLIKAKNQENIQDFHEFSDEEHREELHKEYLELIEKAEKILYKLEHEKVCGSCGKLFNAKSITQKYCSEECSKRMDNLRRDKRIYKNGKPDLSITLTKVYMRDQGVCQICGKHIDFDCNPNSKYYPSIDHIIPLARGGMHQWDNVQLACRKCNTLKSDSIE